jgi:hypothetical protein
MRNLLRRLLLRRTLHRLDHAQRQFLLLRLSRLVRAHNPLYKRMSHNIPIRKVAE